MNYHAAKAFILNKLRTELSEKLSYHGVHHTFDVLNVTEDICALDRISPYHTMLLKTAALFHDSGFVINNQNHEQLGCGIVRENLPRFGYTSEEIEMICGMIMATKIPQSPKTPLEEILCDADLDYLGRDDFYPIGRSLFEELKSFNVLQTEEAWNRIQVGFLEKHSFFTETTKNRRAAKKQYYLDELKALVATYE